MSSTSTLATYCFNHWCLQSIADFSWRTLLTKWTRQFSKGFIGKQLSYSHIIQKIIFHKISLVKNYCRIIRIFRRLDRFMIIVARISQHCIHCVFDLHVKCRAGKCQHEKEIACQTNIIDRNVYDMVLTMFKKCLNIFRQFL